MKSNKRKPQRPKRKKKLFRKIIKWMFRILEMSILISITFYLLQVLLWIFSLNFPWLNIPLPFENPFTSQVENTTLPEITNSSETIFAIIQEEEPPNSKSVEVPTVVPLTTLIPMPTSTPTITPTLLPTNTPSTIPTFPPSTNLVTESATTIISNTTTPSTIENSISQKSYALITPEVSKLTPTPTTTVQPIENYTSTTTLQFTTDLVDILLSKNQHILPNKNIYLSYKNNTIFFASASLIEVILTPDILEYLKNCKIEKLNMQNFITLNLNKILSCVEEYDVSNVIFSWKKERVDEPYQYGLIFEQSIVSLLLNGKCNFDLATY